MFESWVLVILVILAIVFVLRFVNLEGFASKEEKATAIIDWFKSSETPSYEEYTRSVPKTDIVDYSNAYELWKKNKLSVSGLASKL